MLNMNNAIDATAKYVKSLCSAEGSHDWWHIWRVWKLAKRLAEEEGADLFVVELAALLHDVADWKFHDGNETALARNWLMQQSVPADVIEHICGIIAGVSFKGAGVETAMPTMEGKCVQDADRLDASGAIGIARCFAYGGSKGRPLYDPDIPPQMHTSFEEYKQHAGPSLNHFHEKLFLLKDRMQTETGRKLAEDRHRYMEVFVQRFLGEWEEANLNS